MNCLSCDAEILPEGAKLCQKVFVCQKCHDAAAAYTAAVLQDIRDMHGVLGGFVQSTLRTGGFDYSVHHEHLNAVERVEALVRWMEERQQLRCLSSQTPPPSPPTPSSGEALPPHVATLAAIGRRSSSSPTE